MSEEGLPTYVSSLAKLASATEMSETIWREYSRRKEFPPKGERGYDVQAILAWYREKVLPRKKDGSQSSDLNTKKVEKLDEEIALLKLKRAKEERTVADIAEVDSLHLHIATLQKTILFQRLARELGPKCEGKTAAEINVFGRTLAEELCDTFAGGIEQWKAGAAAPAAGP